MDIELHKTGNVQIVRPNGNLKLGDPVDRLRSALDQVVAEGGFRVVLNMVEVPMADSSGIGVLVRYQSALKEKGGALKLVNPSKTVVHSLKILGLLSMFEVFDSEQAGAQSFASEAAAGQP